MLYDPSTSPALHAWLVKTLEPICDAEPEALATYIVALLKHEGPEHDLRNDVTKQLDEFFENGAASFVGTLFATLRSKSYIPYTSSPTSYPSTSGSTGDAGIPIPLDALITTSTSSAPDRGTKRTLDSDEPDARGPPKGPRLNNDGDRWHRNGPYDGGQGDHGMNGMNGGQSGGNVIQAYQMSNGRPMLPKGVCRDYHLKGFCSRGALCKYSHDDIAFTPQMNTGGIPFMNMYGPVPFGMGPGQPSAYDPSDARMDMNAYNRVPLIPGVRNGADDGSLYNPHGELPVIQDLTPLVEAQGAAQIDVPVTPLPNVPSMSSMSDVQMHSSPKPAGSSSRYGRSLGNSPQPQSNMRPMRGGNASYRGRGRDVHGSFGGNHQSFNEELENGRSTKTIVVEKIPDEHLSLEAVNGWFKRYGTVTNVAVDAKGKKALVTFSTREEARAAWAAEEAVFNNRFVKIFWHRPMEGQGSAGARALQASASIVANMGAREKQHTSPVPTQSRRIVTPTSFSLSTSKPVVASSSLSALQSKEELLAKQITEQKELMEKLSTSTGEEKKQVLVRLRALTSEMKSSSPSKISPDDHSRQSSQGLDDKERKKKELLDMELDMHSKTTGEEVAEADEESTEKLREKLAKLRAEASALGITEVMSPIHPPSYRGGYRGRGRGRASYRGAMRGGPPRGSMKLDNRTKSLLVKGVSAHDEEVAQAVRSWFETTEQLASLGVHGDDSFVAAFQTRPAAEQALGKGSNIPSVGTVKLSWFNEPLSPKPLPSLQLASDKKTLDSHPSSPRPEELPEEPGWGNEEDMGIF